MERNKEKDARNGLSELPEINRGLYKFLADNSSSHLARMWLTDTRIGDGMVYTRAAINSKNVAKYYDDLIKEYFESQESPVANLKYAVHEGLCSRQMGIPLGDFCGELGRWKEEEPKVGENKLSQNYLFDSVVSRTEYPRDEGSLFVHGGIEEAVRGIDLIVNDVLNGNSRAEQYLVLGNNSAGKTALASYAIKKFFSGKIPVGYVDVNKLVRWMGNSGGNGESPDCVHAAYNADVVILDELGKICRADGSIIPGTQNRVRNILDCVSEKGAPVIMLYTGDMNNYQTMLKNLQSKKGDKWGYDVARDLGSRLEKKTSIWIKGLCDSDRFAFIKEYLEQRDIPVNLKVEEAVRGIHDTLPSNAQIRRVVGYADSVVFKARCNKDSVIGYDGVVKLLRKLEQRKMLGKYEGAGDVLKKVASYTGVSVSDMKSIRQPPCIANARALAALVLRKELGESWTDISGILNKTHSAMVTAVKKIDGVLALKESELNSKQIKLKELVQGFK